MALSKTSGELLAANQLKIQITTITRNQAWKRQVRGAYHFLYPWILTDFSHTDDVRQWIKDAFSGHKHMVAKEGAPTSAPLPPEAVVFLSNAKGLANIEPNQVLDKVKKGLSNLISTVTDIFRINRGEE